MEQTSESARSETDAEKEGVGTKERGNARLVLGSRYCLAIPKSTTWIMLAPLVPGRPIRKLSGLMSR